MREHPVRRPRHGFSLIEVLVVIGILGVLIAMLLPALQKAWQNAEMVKCQANLRTIHTAAQLHMNQHRSHMPIAGWHFDPPGGVVDPRGLRDEQASKYIYYDDNGIKRPVPVTVALAVSLGVPVRTDSREALEEDMQGDRLRQYFTCPSQDPPLRGLSQKSSEPWEAPREWSSYVFNEAILGKRPQDVTGEVLVGQILRVKRPADVMFAMDGRPRNQTNDDWLVAFNKTPNDSLWDFQQLMLTNPGMGKELPDYLRHQYKANVVFVDGHVGTIVMTQGGMDAVGISRGVGE